MVVQKYAPRVLMKAIKFETTSLSLLSAIILGFASGITFMRDAKTGYSEYTRDNLKLTKADEGVYIIKGFEDPVLYVDKHVLETKDDATLRVMIPIDLMRVLALLQEYKVPYEYIDY